MTVQITIIGLGQIGASIGLALADHGEKILRFGSDIDSKTTFMAQKKGAIDKGGQNLHTAVRDADVVILAVPMNQLREMIEAVAPELKEGAVLMDTAPLKAISAGWAAECLPEGRYYVGLTPVINPNYLHEELYGMDAARADLFHNGMLGISTPPGTHSEAVKLAADLTKLVGATPFFVDIFEIDGLMTTTHLLPQLMSAALLNATLNQPGWQEARKVAGRAYAEATGLLGHLESPDALATAAMLNRENCLRLLDNAIGALQTLRQDIASEDTASLTKHLQEAETGVHRWRGQRKAANWQGEELSKIESPSSPSYLKRLIGLGGKKPKVGKG
jgi:prephenate dehydrogenase